LACTEGAQPIAHTVGPISVTTLSGRAVAWRRQARPDPTKPAADEQADCGGQPDLARTVARLWA
jgi:hypothetical protein